MTLTKAPVKRPTSTHRKRTGQHHRQGNHYRKAYWPYIPIVAILGLGFVLNHAFSHAHHSVLGYATNISNQVLLDDTNVQRAKDSEPDLKLNILLTNAAQAKANDMATKNYWSHVSPSGAQPWSFIQASGYNYEIAGENLAYGFGTSDQVVDAWMHSPEHKANILNAGYQDVGFATANVKNYQGSGPQTIIVALYAQPIGIGVTAYVNGPAAPTPVTINTTAKPVSRLQLITSTTWIQLGLAALCGAAIMLFVVRHALVWHKVLVKGEKFVVHHPLLDVVLVSVAVLVFLLAPIAGSIL